MRWTNATRRLDWYNSSPRGAGRARPTLVGTDRTAAQVQPSRTQRPMRRNRVRRPRPPSRSLRARRKSTPDTTRSPRCIRNKSDRRATARPLPLESASTVRTSDRARQRPSRATRASPHPMSRTTRRPTRRRKRCASRGEQLREERHAVISKVDAQPFRDRHAEVGECGSFTQRSRMNARARNKKRHALACVIGG